MQANRTDILGIRLVVKVEGTWKEQGCWIESYWGEADEKSNISARLHELDANTKAKMVHTVQRQPNTHLSMCMNLKY